MGAGQVEVAVITTGGTIDKSYDEVEGNLKNQKDLIERKILSGLRLPYTKLWVMPILNKDSLHISNEERHLLIKAIQQQVSEGTPVVVLHGTDTMDVSARMCLEEIARPSVPIVFTGAMKPAEFSDSDAYQNVSEALLAVKLLPSGVYISFHNHIFAVPNVRKNRDRGTFETIK